MNRTVARSFSGLMAAALLATPLVVASAGQSAKVPAPEHRSAYAPGVMFPVAGGKAVDLHSSTRTRPGTDIKATCGTVVRAATPGRVVISSSPWSGPNLVRVITSARGLVTWYGYMQSTSVQNGQLVQSGQPIGTVGRLGNAPACQLYFAATNAGGTKRYNATRWLSTYVGKPMNSVSLFDNNGFVLASFNTLGASHTTTASRSAYPTYAWRTPRQLDYLNRLGVDVVGLQEFQRPQRNLFVADAKGAFGIYPTAAKADTDNSIVWRNSTMQFISGTTMAIPYFDGHIRQMPVILLKHKASGREAYFINVHNPASVQPYGNQSKWRAQAIAIERAKIIALRKTGLPVFLTGDLNDGAAAYCPLSQGKLLIAANAIPSMSCAMPKVFRIDWVLAAGPARFTRFEMNWSSKDQRLTDHPIVLTRANLAPAGS